MTCNVFSGLKLANKSHLFVGATGDNADVEKGNSHKVVTVRHTVKLPCPVQDINHPYMNSALHYKGVQGFSEVITRPFFVPPALAAAKRHKTAAATPAVFCFQVS